MDKTRYIVELLLKDHSTFTLPVMNWAKSNRGSTFCPECHVILRGLYPSSVAAQLTQLYSNVPYHSVHHAVVGVIHDSLYNELEPYMKRFARGPCYWEDGSEIENYTTIYSSDYITIRGDGTSEYYVCKTCGVNLGASTDRPYVLRSELPDFEVFQDSICCLYLKDTVARNLKWKNYPAMDPCLIEILDEPLEDDPCPI